MSYIWDSTVCQRLCAIITEMLEIELTHEDIDCLFYEDLGVSSLEKVAIVTKVENEFAVSLTDIEAASMTSLRTSVKVLSSKGAQ